MIISYPASSTRITVTALLKMQGHIIENLNKKSQRKECSYRENRKKEPSVHHMPYTKRARKPFDVLQHFWAKLNEFNEPSQGACRDFTIEKSAQFIGSALL